VHERTYSNAAEFDDLSQRWLALRESEDKLRIRDAATRLEVSEAELLATQLGEGVTPLRPEFKTLIEAMPRLGEIMAST